VIVTPKILVVYDSKSGNTETMALAVAPRRRRDGRPKKKDLAECKKLGERVGSSVLKLNSS
jgi:flavodoxin